MEIDLGRLRQLRVARPSTPGQALRWAADQLKSNGVDGVSQYWLRRWADELDALTAAGWRPPPPEPDGVHWRTGGSVGRTVYDPHGRLVGLLDSPELARAAVQAMNEQSKGGFRVSEPFNRTWITGIVRAVRNPNTSGPLTPDDADQLEALLMNRDRLAADLDNARGWMELREGELVSANAQRDAARAKRAEVTADRDRLAGEVTTWKTRLVDETANLRARLDAARQARDAAERNLDHARSDFQNLRTELMGALQIDPDSRPLPPVLEMVKQLGAELADARASRDDGRTATDAGGGDG